MSDVEITVVSDDGTKYSGQVMTVKSTALTYDDHGILSAWLHCEGDGCGIGVGGYCLDQPKDRDSSDYTRVGTAYGLDHIIRFIETVGAGSWEKIKGSKVIVLRKPGTSVWGSQSVGIANIDTGAVFDLAKHAEAFKAERVSS